MLKKYFFMCYIPFLRYTTLFLSIYGKFNPLFLIRL